MESKVQKVYCKILQPNNLEPGNEIPPVKKALNTIWHSVQKVYSKIYNQITGGLATKFLQSKKRRCCNETILDNNFKMLSSIIQLRHKKVCPILHLVNQMLWNKARG